jgi:hypothetical protein
VTLTSTGKGFIAHVIEKHKKVVKAWLDAREQQTLGRLCRRLRQGDVVKFVKHVRVVDRDWLRQGVRQ